MIIQKPLRDFIGPSILRQREDKSEHKDSVTRTLLLVRVISRAWSASSMPKLNKWKLDTAWYESKKKYTSKAHATIKILR